VQEVQPGVMMVFEVGAFEKVLDEVFAWQQVKAKQF
jgi:hypothetical protein